MGTAYIRLRAKLLQVAGRERGVTLLELAASMGVSALVLAPMLAITFLLVVAPAATATDAMSLNQVTNVSQWSGNDFRSAQLGVGAKGNTVGSAGGTDFGGSQTIYNQSELSWDPADDSMTRTASVDGEQGLVVRASRFIEDPNNVSITSVDTVSPDLVKTQVRWDVAVPGGRTITREESILNFLRGPAREPSAGGFAFFATGDVNWSGSKGVIIGNVHADRTVVSGSDHLVAGLVEGVGAAVGGSNNVFDFVNTRGTSRPMPVSYDKAEFLPYQFSFEGDVNLDSVPEVWQDAERKILRPGVYSATGRLEVSGSHVSGNVTFIANEVKVSGSEVKLTAFRKGVLILAESAGLNAVHLSGSEGFFRGVIYVPNGYARVSGSEVRLDGSIFAANIVVSGSNGWFAYAADLFPNPSPLVARP
ncbi:MAG: hypothetical protein HYU29_07295 [Chloroflexi bacterium]|nr:hypothetical protein [Chloroflexota bacterium]